jgi:hypothetical protein
VKPWLPPVVNVVPPVDLVVADRAEPVRLRVGRRQADRALVDDHHVVASLARVRAEPPGRPGKRTRSPVSRLCAVAKRIVSGAVSTQEAVLAAQAPAVNVART